MNRKKIRNLMSKIINWNICTRWLKIFKVFFLFCFQKQNKKQRRHKPCSNSFIFFLIFYITHWSKHKCVLRLNELSKTNKTNMNYVQPIIYKLFAFIEIAMSWTVRQVLYLFCFDYFFPIVLIYSTSFQIIYEKFLNRKSIITW